MSYDAILARSPSIIYQPGGVAGGLVVTTWAQVQKFIAARQGSVIVYIDDSITSPALVPGTTGITDCEGRVELRPFAGDSINFSVLQIEDGATLANLYSVNAMELRLNCQSATPSLSSSDTASGPFLLFQNEAKLSNASTATQPGIVIPVGQTWDIYAPTGIIVELNAPGVAIVNLATASSTLNVDVLVSFFETAATGWISGVGVFNFTYDSATANEFTNGFVPPSLPAFTGTQQLFPTSSNPQTVGSIIYQPGGTSAGDIVATWPEVQALVKDYNNITANSLQGTNGKFILYVDDSITSPALVPGTTGITPCFGRVIIRPYAADSDAFSVLQIEDGATLQDLAVIDAIEVRCNCQSATPSLTWTITPNGGYLQVTAIGKLSNASTATNPAIVLSGSKDLFLYLSNSFLSLHASAVPLISVAVGSALEFDAYDGSVVVPNFASGAGTVEFEYDNATAFFFTPSGVVPTLPSFTGTYAFQNVDSVWVNKLLDVPSFSAPAVGDVPVFNVDNTWHAATVSSAVTLVGNVNGPAGANRFLALVHNVNDADFAVTEVEGWTWIEMGGLTANRTVKLPAAPTEGEVVVVTDGTASLESFNILINGNGTNVQGTPIYTMSGAQIGARASVALVFDGLDWFIFSLYTPGITGQTFVGPGAFTLKSTSQDMIVFVDTSGGAVNITLPTPLSATSTVQRITFRDLSGTFGTNALTLTPPGTVLINGANTPFPVNAPYPHIVAETNGMNYFV